MPSKQANVAAGTIEGATTPGVEYRLLDAIVGRWMNVGHTFGSDGVPDLSIRTTDIYEWAPGGFFVVHTAFGLIGEQAVGGIEITGRYNPEPRAFQTTFFDSQGNVTNEELFVDATTWRWVGTDVRCTGTLEKQSTRARLPP